MCADHPSFFPLPVPPTQGIPAQELITAFQDAFTKDVAEGGCEAVHAPPTQAPTAFVSAAEIAHTTDDAVPSDGVRAWVRRWMGA